MASGPSASLFSLPLPSWHQPQSARVARYEPRKRRKRHVDWGEDDDDYDDEDAAADGETTDAVSASDDAPTGSTLILSPDEAHQYRVAGLSFDKEIPKGNFPHGPAPENSRSTHTQSVVLKGLASLSPPVYPPQGVTATQQGNLRLHHLAVLTAILHRCLLEGDYIRAGRAWGLILREEYAGVPIDVRSGGRWGIGAEILLRRDLQLSQMASRHQRVNEEAHNSDTRLQPSFTRKGFEDAKLYYERLIIQHPYRKTAPDSVSSMNFYPAMYGLWIYITQEESKMALEGQPDDDDDAYEENSHHEDAMSDIEFSSSSRHRQTRISKVKQKELEQAQQIAARIDELIVSPPYSDSPELLELRGMVSLWIADLFVASLPQAGFSESNSVEESHDSIFARREQRLAIEKRQSELQRSREFFEKAQQRRKGVAYSFQRLHIEDGSPSL
ncbi:hypothetical protein ASPZODRAFT_132843 [Penicilliopsis zonata CBS 506.65]|uniref:Transcription initiation factor Rrn11 n=1 Tax=Penicilliopsis zonata CBS 506.65 TaxID=1073090 RepID=A0A1L9SHM9_9EURO|nr:hypothetical protein ASPZODRAFT_132843 [Penicilliopsis zonata CBS 506.65]OJJ46715.1 hypothetical protein ASPZODRAFT_132843 [Penicilliopsis zonata CBS 506.65]